jgi:C4-dicarboxylate-specific signal transduction histidine kinase
MLSACESQHDREIKEMESRISATIQTDWRDGIPLDSLVEAGKMCREHANLQGCDVVENQMTDIAVSLASCLADERSRLCQTVVRVISKHPVSAMLPKANALQLPDTPWYWNMPTAMLEAQAWNYGYRKETAIRWWDRWRILLLSCAALLSLTYGARVWWLRRKKAIQERAFEVDSQRAADAEWEKIRRNHEEQARVDGERLTKLARDAGIAEQRRQAAEKHAEQQATQAAAKLAAEQAESAMLLSAAFKPTSKPKRGAD